MPSPDASAATTNGPTLPEDAQALKAAAEHIEARYPGMAVLLRRCATRLYESLKAEPQGTFDNGFDEGYAAGYEAGAADGVAYAAPRFSLVRYVADLVTVFQWDRRLYRVVLGGGVVLGFSLGVILTLWLALVGWLVLR